MNKQNLDLDTVKSFGQEWSHFDQSRLPESEAREHFDAYFSTFPWDEISTDARGFDLGCGTGRWARFVAPRVRHLHLIDASEQALEVARRNLAEAPNTSFHHASVDSLPLENGSMDFGYSLGVLHHIPDTEAALSACVSKLKSGAPFLLYLYYALENRPRLFRALWKVSDRVRRVVHMLPHAPRVAVSGAIAVAAYWPFARGSSALERLGFDVADIPLSAYRNVSFYTMRTDAYDRFCTPLEQRFTRKQILEMMQRVGLEHVTFREATPYWCACGRKS